MTTVWPLPLHSGLTGHDWLLQILVFALVAGIWLLAAGVIERRAANRRRHRQDSMPTDRV